MDDRMLHGMICSYDSCSCNGDSQDSYHLDHKRLGSLFPPKYSSGQTKMIEPATQLQSIS